VDIDGAVDMASTLQVTGAANFSDRIGSTYVYPTDATSQTGGVTNHFWKMGRMTLSGPAAAEIELHGLTGYAQNEQIAGKNIIQLRGSNSATVLDGTFHATGDPGVGIQEMRYVPIGDYVFDLYVKLGPFSSLSTTVTCGGTWAPEWTNTGSGSNPASSVDMPAHYALLLGNNIAMYADLSEVVFNDDSNDIDFRVESDGNANMLFVDSGSDRVGIGTSDPNATLSVNGNLRLEGLNPVPLFSVINDANNCLLIDSNSGVASEGYIIDVSNNGTTKAAILGSGNIQNVNNSYGALSDERLKENIVNAESQWNDIKAVTVRKFSLKTDNLDAPNMIGVIAQELESADMTGLIEVSNNTETGELYKGVKYSILYMKAVKALQEAMERIESLEARITALES
jgi:hypothetical protein